MLNVISTLLQFVFNAVRYLAEFLTIVVLGIIGAILSALPWLLRMVALILWLGGAYLGFTTIQIIYTPFSPVVPVLALQFVVILVSVGWVLILMQKSTSFFWGGMATCGLVIGSATTGAIWLLDHWLYADLFFRVLPSALFTVLLIYEATRLRVVFRNGDTVLNAPAFIWFKPNSKATNSRDSQDELLETENKFINGTEEKDAQ